MTLPKIGDKVYKICPKCNPSHNGTCKNCAWSEALFSGACDVGNRIYSDGSGNDHSFQIVTKTVGSSVICGIYDLWNIMYFGSNDAAETALSEFLEICKVEDREKRYKQYLKWEEKRKIINPLRTIAN